MDVSNSAVKAWVDEMARLAKPERIVWLDGSDDEYKGLLAEAVKQGQLVELDQQKHPGCYLHRSNPNDVARTEQCTFICTPNKDDVGPTNNWMEPKEAYAKLYKIFDGIMRGKTMFVVPYLMGPKGSPFSKVGFELTDSVYVAINMRIMTRMGKIAVEHLGNSKEFVKGLHSVSACDPANRYICHFPQDNTIISVNSGYGGNALLSKKCFALRIGSWLGKQQGWLAEHMLITGIEDPQGNVTYIAGAFPSACGKTNLAMLQPIAQFKGYKVWCIGDDIAWLKPGPDGRLYAINPEAGFFGVAPGTNNKSNPNMMKTIARNTIFTNVAMGEDKTVWWEGLDAPLGVQKFTDWQGKEWNPMSGTKGAHPNSRFTAPIKQCPIYSPKWEDAAGVPISAILFGCRRSKLVPLVYESFNWQHGVYLGATLSSETTAAAAGATGVVRRDPMAMLPFCGYNMADYFKHWLEVGKGLKNAPKIFRVNWFNVDESGKFIWPGFGDNIRVIKWIIDRCNGKGGAVETAIGNTPTTDAIDLTGLSLSKDDLARLLYVDTDAWLDAARTQMDFFGKFGSRIPPELLDEQKSLVTRLKKGRGERKTVQTGTKK